MIKKEITQISYRLQFIDSTRFMASSLLNLVNNFAEGIHKIKCKYGNDDKNVKLVEFNTKFVSAFSNTQTHDLIQYICLCCNKNYEKKFNKNLKKQLFNTYKSSYYDINKLIFLLQIHA